MSVPDLTSYDPLPYPRQWLSLLSESLVREGRFLWQLRGSSMEPTLPPDCQIEIVPLPADVPLGALLVFLHRRELVVHRLVHRTNDYWVTQGDNRRETDLRLPPAKILGIVVAAYQNENRVWPGRFEWLATRGWLLRARLLWLRRRLKRYFAR